MEVTLNISVIEEISVKDITLKILHRVVKSLVGFYEEVILQNVWVLESYFALAPPVSFNFTPKLGTS